jgi:hypothetical protein
MSQRLGVQKQHESKSGKVTEKNRAMSAHERSSQEEQEGGNQYIGTAICTAKLVHLYSKMQVYLGELGGLPHGGDRLKERGQPIIGRLAGESCRHLGLRQLAAKPCDPHHKHHNHCSAWASVDVRKE